MLIHAGLLGGLATVTWTVSRAMPEKEYSVGIVLKKATPDGEVFETHDRSYEVPRQRAADAQNFLSETEPAAVADALPKLPEIDVDQIGLSVSLAGTSNLLATPDAGTQTGMMSSTKFFGSDVWGTKFLYVIDRSGSMSERDRLGEAKRELVASLAKLPPTVQFQVIFYNLNQEIVPVGGTSRRLLPATDANKTRVQQLVGRIVPEGGTEHAPALKMALALNPDVIFFLTDADDLRERDVKDITALNKDRARIHTIEFGIGPELERENALRELASSNGGTYRYVDTAKLGR
jgi:hypothetical protein